MRPAGDSCSGSGGGALDEAMWNSADTCGQGSRSLQGTWPVLRSCYFHSTHTSTSILVQDRHTIAESARGKLSGLPGLWVCGDGIGECTQGCNTDYVVTAEASTGYLSSQVCRKTEMWERVCVLKWLLRATVQWQSE